MHLHKGIGSIYKDGAHVSKEMKFYGFLFLLLYQPSLLGINFLQTCKGDDFALIQEEKTCTQEF